MYQFYMQDFKGLKFISSLNPLIETEDIRKAKKFEDNFPNMKAIEIKKETGKQFYPTLIKKIC